jgi:hypothetical protein
MYYFCTYLDKNYLPRGLALYRSLLRFNIPFKLWILCMDQASFETLLRLNKQEIEPIALKDFEDGDTELLLAKSNRSLIEYFFTCTPSLPLYILKRNNQVDMLTYLDADLFFFTDPKPILEEMVSYSIGIIEHRFPPHLCDRERFGIYNVGWISFRNDSNAHKCLKWWRDRCLEWCYDQVEEERYADQKYLNKWPQLFNTVKVIQHKGANLAPWNLSNFRLALKNKMVMVDDQPLIFYHFNGFRKLREWLYRINLSPHGSNPSRILLKYIYQPYIQALLFIGNQDLNKSSIVNLKNSIREHQPQATNRFNSNILSYYYTKLESFFYIIKSICIRDYIIVIKGYVI